MTNLMPTLFIGHGSPMNALGGNSYSKMLNQLGYDIEQNYGKPKAVLCVSAHWQTSGTYVCNVDKPKTIHDFYGFPDELYQLQYPAPGVPWLAQTITNNLQTIKQTDQWGLDHGAWAVLMHLFPKADIPVVQLSLDKNLNLEQHYALAENLSFLRSQGVLILGSGNITHNLRDIDWSPNPQPAAWAVEFDSMIASALTSRDKQILLSSGSEIVAAKWRHAHPSLEHFIPLLYVFAVSKTHEKCKFVHDEIQMGTLSMRSFIF